MPRVTSANLKEAMTVHVHPDATLMTGEFPIYKTLGRTNHQTVNHGAGEYVRGEAHVNTAQGFLRQQPRPQPDRQPCPFDD